MSSRPARPTRERTASGQDAIAVELGAVIVSVAGDAPRVLTLAGAGGRPASLPSGALEPAHRTLEAGLRARVAELTDQPLGYVEQLYTFGDANRHASARAAPGRALSIGYLALVRAAGAPGEVAGAVAAREDGDRADWRSWYDFFPWEDRRAGAPAVLGRIADALDAWAAEGPGPERAERAGRIRAAFGAGPEAWDEELALERYELLYEVGLVVEAHRDGVPCPAPREAVIDDGESLIADHRRILATAISRLRGKIKYRPLVFELMAPRFTFLQLQRTVEALAGVQLHKSNFRRLVEHQGLVEDTGAVTAETGGRPARLLRFRSEVTGERVAPGVRLPALRPGAVSQGGRAAPRGGPR